MADTRKQQTIKLARAALQERLGMNPAEATDTIATVFDLIWREGQRDQADRQRS